MAYTCLVYPTTKYAKLYTKWCCRLLPCVKAATCNRPKLSWIYISTLAICPKQWQPISWTLQKQQAPSDRTCYRTGWYGQGVGGLGICPSVMLWLFYISQPIIKWIIIGIFDFLFLFLTTIQTIINNIFYNIHGALENYDYHHNNIYLSDLLQFTIHITPLPAGEGQGVGFTDPDSPQIPGIPLSVQT